VDGNRPERGPVDFCPGQGYGIEDGGNLGYHAVPVKRRLKGDIARVWSGQVFRQSEGVDTTGAG
jgi:hypothetical protein